MKTAFGYQDYFLCTQQVIGGQKTKWPCVVFLCETKILQRGKCRHNLAQSCVIQELCRMGAVAKNPEKYKANMFLILVRCKKSAKKVENKPKMWYKKKA